MERTCEGCGGEIPPTRAAQARYCSNRCRSNHNSRLTFKRHPDRVRRYKREWAARHPETARRWKKNNPERAAVIRRRSEKRLYQIDQYGHELGDDPLAYAKDRFRAARTLGYRSGLEVKLARQLESAGVSFEYELVRIPYMPTKARHYVPDLILASGICIEAKGRWETADRQKILLVKQQHPQVDIRLVFSNANQRISKQSKTTYAAYCDHKGIMWADKVIPDAWLREPPNIKSLKAIEALHGKSPDARARKAHA